jgi:hypothetical protein
MAPPRKKNATSNTSKGDAMINFGAGIGVLAVPASFKYSLKKGSVGEAAFKRNVTRMLKEYDRKQKKKGPK